METNPNSLQETEYLEPESQFDLRTIFYLIWNQRWWMLLSAIICTGIAAFYLHTKSDIYASQMMILITTDQNAGMSNSSQMMFIQDMTGMSSYNSLGNEKVILRSTPVIQQVVEDMHLNIRYYVSHAFKDEENLGEEIQMQFFPDSSYNVNNLPLLRIEYDIIDSTQMMLSILDSKLGKKTRDGYLYRDTLVTLPAFIDLPVYGSLAFTFHAQSSDKEEQDSDEFEYRTPGDHYILLYSPQIRAREISADLEVEIEEDGRRSSFSGSGSSILMLTLSDNIPTRAEQVLEKIVEQYNLQTKTYYSVSNTNTMDFIQNRLADLKAQLSGVEDKFKDFSVDNDMYDLKSQTDISLKAGMQKEEEVKELDIQIQLLKMIATDLKEDKVYNTIPTNIGITDNSINSSIQAYNTLCVERLRLMSGASENSPVVKKIELQLQASRNIISKSVDNQISILTSQRNELKGQIGHSRTELKNLPNQRLGLAAIEREQSVIEPLYVLLQKKREETMLAIIAEPDIARIIEHAENTSLRIGPNRRVTLCIALLLGLMIPLGIAYLKLLLKTKITGPEDIEQRTSVTILGMIPKSSEQITKAKNIIQNQRSSIISEVFRSLRANLAFLNAQVIQVTSSIPGEGKSIIATNLAITYAAVGKKVILVETDMRKGHMRRTFDLPRDNQRGLSDYLIEKGQNWHNHIFHIEEAGHLDVMPKGSIPPNPNELLSSDRFEELIKALRAEYDYVILDSPPYLLIADPVTVNRVTDCNIYVMRAGISDLHFAEEIERASEKGQLTRPVIVLNGFEPKNARSRGGRYGYGYGYAYGYGYGYSHESGSKKRTFAMRMKSIFRK